jgi:hypothetical protein
VKVTRFVVAASILVGVVVAIGGPASRAAVPERADPLATVFALQTEIAGADAPTPTPKSAADGDGNDAEATISALQTRIAELEGKSPEPATKPATSTPRPKATTPAPDIETPAPAPTPSDPVPLNDAFELLYYYFAQDASTLYVFGEIRNVSDQPAVAPAVVFTFLDEAGNAYGDQIVWPVVGWVPGGDRVPFQQLNVLGSALLPGDWADVSVTAGEPYGILEDLDPSNIEIQGIPLEGPVHPLHGTIQNNGPESIGPLTITIAYYDEEDRFVGSCTGKYLDLAIPPGRSIRLDIPAGGCGFLSIAKQATNANGPFTYRLFI